jgi:hypothetical protein
LAEDAMNETQKHAAEVLKLKSQLDQAKADGKVTSVLEQQAAQQEAALLQSRILADQLATELRAQEQQQQTVLEALRVNFASRCQLFADEITTLREQLVRVTLCLYILSLYILCISLFVAAHSF